MAPRSGTHHSLPSRACPCPPVPAGSPLAHPVPVPPWCPVTVSPVSHRPVLPRRPPSLATPRPSLQGSAVPCRPGLPRVPCAPAGYPVVPCPGPPRAHTSRVPLSPPVLAYPAALTLGLHRAHPSRAPPPWPRPGLPHRPPFRALPRPSLPRSPPCLLAPGAPRAWLPHPVPGSPVPPRVPGVMHGKGVHVFS